MRTHRLDAGPDTVHWGFFDAALKPLVTVEPGDEVIMSTVSGALPADATSEFGFDRAGGAPCDSRQRAAETERAAHHDRAGRRAWSQGWASP